MIRSIAFAGVVWLLGPIHVAQAAGKKDTAPAVSVRLIGRIASPAITESSGVVPCATGTNLFWTHNDGPNPALFAITPSGQSVAQFVFSGIQVTDWEDIARDDAGNLYLADIGNNDARRDRLMVHQFVEPKPEQPERVLRVQRSWTLRFPDKPFDCESLFIWKGRGYVISKVFKKEPAALYSFELTGNSSPVVLKPVATLPVNSPVTGADISPDGREIALVSKAGAYRFQIDGQPERAGEATPRFSKFREGQIEGCCFTPDGLLATSEKREVFLFGDAAFEPVTSTGSR